jgi:hypothetical protein
LAVFGTFGIWQMTRGLGDVSEAWQSAGWPTTAGTVLSAKVSISTSHSTKGGNSTSYKPVISYSYAVSGEDFTGSVIAPGRTWGSASAYAVVRRFNAGSHPAVSYSPAHPGRSVLVPGLHLYNFASLLFGLIAFSFAAIFGVFAALGPRYGQPDGRGGYNFNKGPVGWVFLFAVLLIFAEFGLLFWIS